MTKFNPTWLANLRWIEENSADFFATGGSQAMVGLDLNYLPSRGVNLSGTNQSLLQGYQTAKHIFEHVKPGTIKFVLIDLSPMLFPSEESEEFDPLNTQSTSAEDVDLNCEQAKENFRKKFSEKQLEVLARKNLPTDDNLEENSQILQDYAKLCFDNGARPIFVTLPVEQTLKKIYNADVLTRFRQAIVPAGKKFKSLFIDLLDVKLAGDCFYGKSHLSLIGAIATTALIGAKLCLNNVISTKQLCEMNADYFNMLSKYCSKDYKNLIHYVFCKIATDDFKRLSKILPPDECKDLMARVFSNMTYDHLAKLTKMLPKDDYNDLAERVFKISVEKIRRKNKIKVGFVLYNSSMWSGDDLYNLFANNERFEVTVFLCLQNNNSFVKKDFLHGVEQFKSRGINVIPIEKRSDTIPVQDVIVFLTPYFSVLATDFRPENICLKTLITYIPYTLTVSQSNLFNNILFFADWKTFFPSAINLDIYLKGIKLGMPRGFYSGYPRLDVFFKDNANFKFDWKLVRPDAKKIIWAPHWSITGGVKFATFQWNYKLMYEFAKTHPEISWILKPHPNLLFSATRSKVFPSAEAFEEYLRAWNDLPNAQVYTGAYYQAIFATSDGMIQDSASFVAEYQYVDKPMIYLTRDTQKFNELGNEILKVSYLVDGKDFDAIAAMIQRVFIEGDDYKAAERREVFDKYLNYPKTNGMLASEFIYKSITDELKEA